MQRPSGASNGSHDEVPIFLSSLQYQRLELLTKIFRDLDKLPQTTECSRCSKPTGSVRVISLTNDSFHVQLPVAVCRACSRRLNVFSDSHNLVPHLRWILPVCTLLLLSLPHFLPAAILLCVSILFFPVSRFITMFVRQRGQRRIDEFCVQLPHVAELRSLEPDLIPAIPADHPLIPIAEFHSTPWFFRGVFDLESNVCLSTRRDLARTGVAPDIISLLINAITAEVRSALRDRSVQETAAVQVDVVLLPRRRRVFDLQITGSDEQAIADRLLPALKQLPAVGVRWPFVFCVRLCRQQGLSYLAAIASPFPNWKNRPLHGASLSWSEVAVRMFGVHTPDDTVTLTIDDCVAWQQRGDASDAMALTFSQLLRDANSVEDAITVIENQLKKSPDNPVLYSKKGELLSRLGQTERAAALCQQVVGRFPSYSPAWVMLAALQFRLGIPTHAWKTLRRAPAGAASADDWVRMAKHALLVQDSVTAFACLSTAMLKDLSLARAWLIRADLLQDSGQASRALSDLQYAETCCDEKLAPEVIRKKINVLVALRQYENAVRVATEGLRRFPKNPLLLMGRADALLIAGKSELALVDSCNVLRLVPNFFPALMLRCLIHQSAGNHPAALADAEAAIAAGCPLAAGLYLRGQSRIHLAQPQEALPDVLQAVQLDPASVDYRYSLAVTWSLLQNLNAAIAELDLVLTIDSHLTAARLLRGLLHINQNALDKAADDLDHVLQQPGFFGLAFFGRALVHRLRGEYELALQLLNQALLMDPTDADCLRERAILAAIRSEMTAAEQDINESLLWKPDDLRALLIRASLRLAGGRIDAAARDLQQIRRGSPDPKIAENVEIGLEIIERLRRERGNQSESS